MAHIESIRSIKETRDDIRNFLKDLDLKQFKDQTFGPEGEYTYRGMIGGIESLLTDISTLTRYEQRFIKLSTYNDRTIILNNLKQIHSNLNYPNNLYQFIDNLKNQLRNFNLRFFSENLVEFDKEIDNVRKQKLEFQDLLRELYKEKEKIEKNLEDSENNLNGIESNLEELEKSIKKITAKSEDLKSTNNELDEIKLHAQSIFEKIQKKATEVESNQKLIESFAKNVEERNKKLTEIEQRTAENDDKLEKYEEERKNILKESEQLIESAKQALNYKTAEGLSASFHSQYKDAEDKGKLKAWIWGGGISLILTLALGVWILYNIQDEWFMVLGRILLLPIPIAAATFCAQQYNKQKNIIEDYAYKTTIAKAIVGFSEQLKKNGKEEDNSEYVEYIQKALAEIHKDPLRSRKEKKEDDLSKPQFDQILTLAKKIVELSKLSSTN